MSTLWNAEPWDNFLRLDGWGRGRCGWESVKCKYIMEIEKLIIHVTLSYKDKFCSLTLKQKQKQSNKKIKTIRESIAVIHLLLLPCSSVSHSHFDCFVNTWRSLYTKFNYIKLEIANAWMRIVNAERLAHAWLAKCRWAEATTGMELNWIKFNMNRKVATSSPVLFSIKRLI